MTKDVTIIEVCDFLRVRDNFTLLAHASPDGDTIGSCYALGLALQSMGKKVRILVPDPIPSKFSFIEKSFTSDTLSGDETIVSLDVADIKLLGKNEELFGNKIELCIDHHISNRRYSKMLLLDGKVGANCEIIFNVLKELKVEFTSEIIAAIYTGIVTDTGCFKFSNTTKDTHIIASSLIEMGVDYAEINRIIFDSKSRARIKIEGSIMENMEYYFDGLVSFVTVSKGLCLRAGADESDLDGINALSRTVEGVMVGVTAREKRENHYKVSVRTNAPIDASRLCSIFGGGGHIRASGCSFNCSLDELKAQLLPEIEKALEDAQCLA